MHEDVLTIASDIAFSWHGLPQYSARAIKAALDRIGYPCPIIASRPEVPIRGMEDVLGQRVHWIDDSVPTSWNALGLRRPSIFFQSGWSYPAFNALGRDVKKHGGKVVGIADTNWRGDWRQLVLGPIGFRVRHRRSFDAMIVPGSQGARTMRYFGMPVERIHLGMNGADPTLFNGGDKLANRPKQFLFVGQFIARKDVIGLARAFIRFCRNRPDWTLSIIGGGEQAALIPSHPQITIDNFVQPGELADRFRQARFFVLPSHVEAWGLVVHEAALSGCGLLLSNAIGSGDDLASADNAIRFPAGSEDALVSTLQEAADWSAERLTRAEQASRTLASQFGPSRFADAVCAEITNARRTSVTLSSTNGIRT